MNYEEILILSTVVVVMNCISNIVNMVSQKFQNKELSRQLAKSKEYLKEMATTMSSWKDSGQQLVCNLEKLPDV